MGEHAEGFGALPVRSSLARVRPWVTDGVFIAHESLPLFTLLAGQMGRNGWWRMTSAGLVSQAPPTGPVPDVAAFITRHVEASTSCVVEQPDYERLSDKEAAAARALADDGPRVEVLDPDGRVWHFNPEYIEAATFNQTGWSWRIAPALDAVAAGPRNVVLIGLDRKDRPRFVVCNVIPEAARPAPVDTVDRERSAAHMQALIRMVLAQATGHQDAVTAWLTHLPDDEVFPAMCGLARMIGVSMLGEDLDAGERAILACDDIPDAPDGGHVVTAMEFVTAVTNRDLDGAHELLATAGAATAGTVLATLVGFAGEMWRHHSDGRLDDASEAELDQIAAHLVTKHLDEGQG